MGALPPLLGQVHPIEGRLDPEPGLWLVIFKKGGGKRLVRSGQRKHNFGFNEFLGLSYAQLQTSTVELAVDLSGVILGEGYVMPRLGITLGLRLNPETGEDALLQLITEEASSFTHAIEVRIRYEVEQYVRQAVLGVDPMYLYQVTPQAFLFPGADGRRLSKSHLTVTTATVTALEWPESLKIRLAHQERQASLSAEQAILDIDLQNELDRRKAQAQVDLELDIARVTKLGEAELRVEVMRAMALAEVEIENRTKMAELEGKLRMKELESAQETARRLGVDVTALPGPWSELSGRAADLLGKALDNPALSRRPEILGAVLALARGERVGEDRLRMQAEQVINAADPDFVQSAPSRRVMSSDETRQALQRARFVIDDGLAALWRHLDAPVELRGAAYDKSRDGDVAVVLVLESQYPLPDQFLELVSETLEVPETAPLRAYSSVARTVEPALRDFFEQYSRAGSAIEYDFTFRLTEAGEGQVVVGLSGDPEQCAALVGKANNPRDPFLRAAAKVFHRGNLQLVYG